MSDTGNDTHTVQVEIRSVRNQFGDACRWEVFTDGSLMGSYPSLRLAATQLGDELFERVEKDHEH